VSAKEYKNRRNVGFNIIQNKNTGITRRYLLLKLTGNISENLTISSLEICKKNIIQKKKSNVDFNGKEEFYKNTEYKRTDKEKRQKEC